MLPIKIRQNSTSWAIDVSKTRSMITFSVPRSPDVAAPSRYADRLGRNKNVYIQQESEPTAFLVCWRLCFAAFALCASVTPSLFLCVQYSVRGSPSGESSRQNHTVAKPRNAIILQNIRYWKYFASVCFHVNVLIIK